MRGFGPLYQLQDRIETSYSDVLSEGICKTRRPSTMFVTNKCAGGRLLYSEDMNSFWKLLEGFRYHNRVGRGPWTIANLYGKGRIPRLGREVLELANMPLQALVQLIVLRIAS